MFTTNVYRIMCTALVIGVFGWQVRAQPTPSDLRLWNTLDSQSAIENSEVGLDGSFLGGTFVPGVYGNAYRAEFREDLLVNFPYQVIPDGVGTIEFWARFTHADFTPTVNAEQNPMLFFNSGGVAAYGITFTSNDGLGGGGLAGVIAGHNCATGGFLQTHTYAQILGIGQETAWHHYALVWDEAGLPGIGHTTAVFMDGVQHCGRWHNPASSEIPAPVTGTLGMVRNESPWGTVDIDNLKIWGIARTDFSDRCAGDISGVVMSDGSPLAAVTVKLLDDQGIPVPGFDDQSTDNLGAYHFLYVTEGEFQVMIVEPLGYTADANPATVTLTCGSQVSADFALSEFIILNSARGKGYWKHQFDVYIRDKGNAHESEADLLGYISDVESRYTSPHYPSIFADMADGTNDFEEWQSILSPKKKPSMEQKVKAHLAALVLNVVSLKIAQYEVVTEDGRNVGDVVTYVSELLTNGDASDDELAKDLAESVNNQMAIATGVVPEGSALLKRGPETLPNRFALYQNFPNPFNPVTLIAYDIPEATQVTLTLFDLLGRELRLLERGDMPAGRHLVEFDAADLSSGTYLYRLEAGNFAGTRSLVILK